MYKSRHTIRHTKLIHNNVDIPLDTQIRQTIKPTQLDTHTQLETYNMT
jgi:hypothetical protein